MGVGSQTLDEMIDEVSELLVEKGWRASPKTFGDDIALVHSELSEALEAFRDYGSIDFTRIACERKGLHNPEEDHGHLCKPEGIGSEFADVFIRLLDMCDTYNIDLAHEYWRKMAYNRTRPYQHGGRTLADKK